MRKKVSKGEVVLGVSVTERSLFAVLARPVEGRAEVIRRFTRERGVQQERVASPASVFSGESFSTGEEADYKIHFGDGGGDAADLFLRSEFENLGVSIKTHEGPVPNARSKALPFASELKGIIDECRALGYDLPLIGVCLATSEVSYAEVQMKAAGATKRKKAATGILPAQWVAEIAKEKRITFSTERVGLMPMTAQRLLAVIPEDADSVVSTLQALHEGTASGMFPVRLFDCEASLYAGLMRASGQAVPEKTTLLVRVGSQDTLVLLLDGLEVRYCEQMRSVTEYDTPETVCSRVLLQQDEQGISGIDRILVLGEKREAGLLNAFRTFFPEADVLHARETLSAFGMLPAEELPGVNAASELQASAVALRLALPAGGRLAGFDEINLLPKKLRRRPIRLPFAWHTALTGLLLLGVMVFFTSSFLHAQKEIDSYRHRLSQFPPDLTPRNSEQLQLRIDSLQQMADSYTRAIEVGDSLLAGSDRWSRLLAKASAQAARIPGIWIEIWQPQGEHTVMLQGSATTRKQIMDYAERMDASIEMMRFSEIREFPVYEFIMVVPLTSDLPQALIQSR